MAKPRTEIDVAAVEKHAAAGLAEYQIAAAVGVSADTFTKRKRDTPGVAEALARGRTAAIGQIENAAYECALKAVGDSRYQTSMIFWLKVNAGWKERTVVETVQADEVDDRRDALIERVRALSASVAGTSVPGGDSGGPARA